jgi:hypothetical protein
MSLLPSRPKLTPVLAVMNAVPCSLETVASTSAAVVDSPIGVTMTDSMSDDVVSSSSQAMPLRHSQLSGRSAPELPGEHGSKAKAGPHVNDTSTSADDWHTGPLADPRRYRVDDPTPLPGGQSYVFRATDASGQMVSLKLLDADGQRAANAPERAATELAAIQHQGLASIIDVFTGPGLWHGEIPPEDAFSYLYVASSWVDGQSLSQAAPLAPAAVGQLVRDLTEAVDEMHSAGFVHGDLHPGNVVVQPHGSAVVIDLGAARPIDDGEPGRPTGVVGFLPPEAGGTPAADRWAVGMLAVFALLGHPQGRQPMDTVSEELENRLRHVAGRAEVIGLLQAMIDPDPLQRPDGLTTWGAALADALHRDQPSRRKVWAAVAVVTVAVLGGSVALATHRDQGTASPTSTTVPCNEEPTSPAETVPEADGTRFEAARQNLTPAACATGAVQRFGKALHQPIRDNQGAGVIVLSPGIRALRLSEAQWASYREIAGRARPENAILFGGFPTSVQHTAQGWLIPMSESGEILGARSDTQSFWMPKPVLEAWRAHGGFKTWGYPTSNPYFEPGGMLQDFEFGYFEVPHAPVPLESITADMVITHRVEDRLAPTRGLGDVRGHILRQNNGVAWFIDQQGRRRWIKDGGTWNCLGGDKIVIANSLSGWATAAYPLGSPAACPDQQGG